jgi:hypothetical protein
MTVPDGGQQQGGGGQQQGGGQQDSGQQGGGQQQQNQQQPPAPPQQQQPSADSIARAARLDGEGEGYQKAARELGVSIEEAKNIIQDHRQKADAEKTAQQRLADREGELKTAQEESTNHKKRADAYEKVMKDAVAGQIDLIADEGIKELLSSMDVAGQFGWLQKHGAKYVQQQQGQQQDDQQQQGPPDQFQQLQNLQGPDATRRERIPGLGDADQQFNDILRERGLSSGVPLQ